MLSVFGTIVFVALFGGMLRANARRWRILARSYAGEQPRAIEQRHMQSAALISTGGYNSFKGILTIGVHENGMSLKVMPLFSLFHDPLFVPYGEIKGWSTSWYLDAKSTELTLARAPDVKIILPREQAEWIRKFSGQQMVLRDVSPPEGNTGRGWHALKLIHAGVSLAMLGWLGIHFLIMR